MQAIQVSCQFNECYKNEDSLMKPGTPREDRTGHMLQTGECEMQAKAL